ncbi:hypothetical protein ACFLYH_03110, partial [Candidatus Dependentiae bacterium]
MFEYCFFKYQSLGNDFILLDFLEKETSLFYQNFAKKGWSYLVEKTCQRHFGIGSDGILVLLKDKVTKLPEILIFNSDGTRAEICLNGLRCVVKHLYCIHKFEKKFDVKMGNKIIHCQLDKFENDIYVTTKIVSPIYLEEKCINIEGKKFCGHIIDAGNQHFIIFEKTNMEWLKK